MPAPVVRRAPYKDFLQPCLQRRFASTLLVVLAISYAESLTLSSWTSVIWSWFPLGIAGLRTLAIFGSALFIVILRIAHPHIGLRTSNSGFHTFRQYALTFETCENVLTYAISAFTFSQVYLYSVGEHAGLQWITYHSGRARLNERALFYTVSLTLLGVFEGVMHSALDYDRLLLGSVRAKTEEEENGTAKQASKEDPFEKLVKVAPRLVMRAATNSIGVCLANYLTLYSLFFRRTAWWWTMTFFRPLYNLPKTNIPPPSGPWSVWMLFRSVLAGFLLCLLWNFGNATLTLRLAKEPLKNGQPLTAESKDPNGSLLNGLKAKKPRNQAFAMWELALIARDFDARRKGIFEDIDRKDGPMWSQLYVICLDTIKHIEKRVDEFGKAPAPPPAAAKPDAAHPPARIVEPPVSAMVWQDKPAPKTFRDTMGSYVDKKVRSPGKKPADIGPLAKQTVTELRDSLLTKEQQQYANPNGIAAMWSNIFLWLLQYPIGWPFKQLFSRRLSAAVLGTPHGEVSIYVNAAFTLSQLSVASLSEDNYGNVHRDVPAIIRTLTTVIKKLEIFRDNLAMHWTDLEASRHCGPVEELLEAFKDALDKVVTAFEQYSTDLRLSRTDLRLAKEAAKKAEPAQPAAPEKPQQQKERRAAEKISQPEMKQVG
ncbi:nucleoporin protein Ndc1-Nup [Apiospora arundinis]|uniref:Nucleoporin protein Ndc1-Nup n=1 Tax=Apiospora arundinis TaxID=335852 RepID=A0ABR2IET8_9PEZI